MATFVGSASSSSSWIHLKNSGKNKGKNDSKNNGNKFKVSCVSSAGTDPYKTLRIRPGATESEVKKAFRQLALQYHPDVCKGSNCDIQFHQINEAYDMVMSQLRGESIQSEMEMYDEEIDDDYSFRGMNDPDWELWEEWMGWEGAGIRDYTSHINPYI